jgi:Heparinase II/III-like protein.
MNTSSIISIPYEDFSNTYNERKVANNINITDHVISNGWELGKYGPVFLSEPIPWSREEETARSWHAQLQGLELIDPLLRAHNETQEEKYLRIACCVSLDWVNAHCSGETPGQSSYVWDDMAVGFRAYRLAYVFDSGKKSGLLKEREQSLLWDTLLQHHQYLADDANIKFHNNHALYQIYGQMAMGRRLTKYSPDMAQAYRQGKERLKVVLPSQFAKDGSHLEHSPDYHRMVYLALMSAIKAELITDYDIINFCEKIEEALSWFVLPNGYLVNFGDSDYRNLSYTTKHAKAVWQTPAMRYVTTGGKIGSLPAETLKAFTLGGYFVIRRPNADWRKTSYLAQQAGFHSRTHKHADDLTLIWHDHGSDILVDAGRYGYLGRTEKKSELWQDGFWYANPARVYCESTKAHNTLEFDGINYSRRNTKPYGSALQRWVEHPSGLVAIETECKQFNSIRQARVLFFMPSQWLLVFDWFHDNAGQMHDVKQWFHVAPAIYVLANNKGGYTASVPDVSAPLQVVSLLPSPTYSPLYLGQDKDTSTMQGWWSPKEQDIVPNYAFHYTLSRVSQGAFATLFAFSNKLVPDSIFSKCNISGRKGQMQWQDDKLKHTLSFSRFKKEKLEIIYNELHLQHNIEENARPALDDAT